MMLFLIRKAPEFEMPPPELAVLFVTVLLLRFSVPGPPLTIPPPDWPFAAVLPLIVLLVMFILPEVFWQTAPPPEKKNALLLLSVLLLILIVPPLILATAPPHDGDRLPVRVLPMILRVPLLKLQMPPPPPVLEVLLLTAQFKTVRVPRPVLLTPPCELVPFVRVKPDNITVSELGIDAEKTAVCEPAEMVSALAPGPLIARLLLVPRAPLVKLMGLTT